MLLDFGYKVYVAADDVDANDVDGRKKSKSLSSSTPQQPPCVAFCQVWINTYFYTNMNLLYTHTQTKFKPHHGAIRVMQVRMQN